MKKAFVKNKWAYQAKRTFIIGEVKALMLWLAAYLMGLPPTGLYTLNWTHGLTLADTTSREKIRISPISVFKKRLRTAFPKEPVPPVIMSVLSLKIESIS